MGVGEPVGILDSSSGDDCVAVVIWEFGGPLFSGGEGAGCLSGGGGDLSLCRVLVADLL